MNIFTLITGIWMSILALFGTAPSDISSLPVVQGSTSTAHVERPVSPTTTATQSDVHAPVVGVSGAPTQVSTNTAAPTTLSGSAWETTLPLGDGKYTTNGPKKGYIYICHVAQGGGGAQGSPTWIHGSTWNPSEKVSVEGAVSWSNAAYSMSVSGTLRTIKSNGLPTDHTSGTFPIQSSDPASQFDRNPNSISAQNYTFSLPVSPTELAQPTCIYGQVGIMDDGVPLFDGFDAEYRDAAAHEVQDAYEAHPEKTGAYHYHGFEQGFVQQSVSSVVGFAFDGFPITGSKLSDGTYLHTADLDGCHGTTSTITLDGKTVTMYHYVLTQDFPYSVGCFRGKSYEPKPVGAGSGSSGTQGMQSPQGGGGTPGAPPQGALDACTGKQSENACWFSTPQGTMSGVCRTPPGQSSLACVPN